MKVYVVIDSGGAWDLEPHKYIFGIYETRGGALAAISELCHDMVNPDHYEDPDDALRAVAEQSLEFEIREMELEP